MNYRIVIIGGGPGGYVAAIRAAKLGAKVALVEKDQVGGTCLNWGCIPTKALVSQAALVAAIRRSEELGIQVGQIAVDYGRMKERKDQVVNKLVGGVQYLLKKNKVEVIQGAGRIVAPGQVKVDLKDGGEMVLDAENIILATGTRPALIPALGYDGQRVMTSDEILNLTELPGEMLIIGGGVIGCEFACIFAELGVKITIVEALPTLLSTVDRDVQRQMQSILKKRGITVKTKSKITAVTKTADKVMALLENGEELVADKILISIGRTMNLAEQGLAELGVQFNDRGAVQVDSRLRTSVPGIYAIGDITGKIQLAHVASAQGMVAVDHIMGKEKEMDYSVVPSCIFTIPETAGVGLTTQEAEARGIKIKAGKFPFMASGKAVAMGETEGFVKILADPDTDRILGVHILGPHATDLIGEATLAIQLGATVEQLAGTIHAHPTLSEAVLEAAEALHGMAVHI
ncbi:dihydrolipoyl dehydrogenase [Desulforamulus ruminis]|uniref:Dihydrolipoyl dehydrogenase n=1 Tax=Desulforamulus ruminis (strain ATCC 23193 / DSM 2154 / NCIMB 8452 / DL) TaxID=696281 RepID=F6DKX3_DESRL|nr:dihydrolipoyl dehydrogenase [Desulforamulus ruminis]AEG61605.1 dihydrolipoamide dehydrogenase [Desulforamulus ruminis DSM 2154]